MKSKYLAIAALAATTMFVSCVKENNSIRNEEDEVSSSIQVSISIPRSMTKATSDENATDVEVQINTVDVFIYTASGNFSSHTNLSSTDFKEPIQGLNDDVYESITKIQTTTGPKTVFVGVNLPAGMASSLENKSASILVKAVQEMDYDELTGTTGSTDLILFSTKGVSSIFEANEDAPANKITVKCEHLNFDDVERPQLTEIYGPDKICTTATYKISSGKVASWNVHPVHSVSIVWSNATTVVVYRGELEDGESGVIEAIIDKGNVRVNKPFTASCGE